MKSKSIKQRLKEFGEKEMDRGEFLKHMVVGVAGVVGAKSAVTIVSEVDLKNGAGSHVNSGQNQTYSYNGGKFNG